MPAKAKKASIRRPLSPTRTSNRRQAVTAAKVAAKSDANFWTKPHFQKEQEHFFACHPNSKVLLTVFLLALVFYAFIAWENRMDLFPQLFMY